MRELSFSSILYFITGFVSGIDSFVTVGNWDELQQGGSTTVSNLTVSLRYCRLMFSSRHNKLTRTLN